MLIQFMGKPLNSIGGFKKVAIVLDVTKEQFQQRALELFVEIGKHGYVSSATPQFKLLSDNRYKEND